MHLHTQTIIGLILLDAVLAVMGIYLLIDINKKLKKHAKRTKQG